ncbi:hypothetical protein BSL78_01929 [Apostichopus japonicus]|uniref:Uncharacterized protein n=1 Tax=Stichopus japonicus TaxID=307972 RepID=A0A2G8LLI7_STIJA|nr:hypothetical protein BSL78_01929 [Apostichopus japonicus]
MARLIADGSSASGYGGGGSGGAIALNITHLTGHGIAQTNGGAGTSSYGGGGSGGRIAVYVTESTKYEGSFQAIGGSGYGSGLTPHGGPGSVYFHESRFGYPYHKLFIDNVDRSWDHYFTIDEPGERSEYFDEIHLTSSASLHLPNDGVPRQLTINKLYGDKTGLITVHGNQQYTIDHRENSKTTLKAPVNFKLEKNSTAFIATTFDIIGSGVPAFDWNGRLVGVQNLRIAPGREVLIRESAHTALIVDDNYEYIDVPGEFRFVHLEFGALTNVAFPPPLGVRFKVGFLDMKWGSQLTAEYFEIYSSDLHLEPIALWKCPGEDSQMGDLVRLL